MVGDVDRDGRADLLAWHPGTGMWNWLTSSSAYRTGAGVQWGNESLGDVPLAADLDGDRAADLVVWRASTRTWYRLTSSSGYSPAASGLKPWKF